MPQEYEEGVGVMIYVCMSCGTLQGSDKSCETCGYKVKPIQDMTEQDCDDLFVIAQTEGWSR